MPLVSIGLPVRNGAQFLDEALTLLREQTYKNIEIIISDNASDDGSTQIIQRHAAVDRRIQVHRSEIVKTALDNFRFVFEQARGDYFMWAACDDRRSIDYVEALLKTMLAHPEASLVFGDVARFSDFSQWQVAPLIVYLFETVAGESWRSRIRLHTQISCLDIYGLIRSSFLRSYEWFDIDFNPDVPLVVYLAFRGEFIRADNVCFYYYAPVVPKSIEYRAVAYGLHKLRRGRELRLAWTCALAANHAGNVSGKGMAKLGAFVVVYMNRYWRSIKPVLFRLAPLPVVRIYRKWFKRGYA